MQCRARSRVDHPDVRYTLVPAAKWASARIHAMVRAKVRCKPVSITGHRTSATADSGNQALRLKRMTVKAGSSFERVHMTDKKATPQDPPKPSFWSRLKDALGEAAGQVLFGGSR